MEGKFEACIPGNHGKQEFPLTPALRFCIIPLKPLELLTKEDFLHD